MGPYLFACRINKVREQVNKDHRVKGPYSGPRVPTLQKVEGLELRQFRD